MPPQRVGFFAPFWSENGFRICPFWSGNGYGFRGNYGSVWTIYRFNSNWVNKKEKCANSKWISGDFLVAVLIYVKTLKVRSENGCEKWHFLVWNRVRIWRTGRHTPTKNFQEYPSRNQTSCKRRSSRPGVGVQLPEVGQISRTLRGKLK